MTCAHAMLAVVGRSYCGGRLTGLVCLCRECNSALRVRVTDESAVPPAWALAGLRVDLQAIPAGGLRSDSTAVSPVTA
jgi:hypothetical protein